MTGHIRRRGKRSWELKFDIGRDAETGRRKTAFHSFKGTKREAEAELVRLKAGADGGVYVAPAKVTLAELVADWQKWTATQVSAKTLERYAELAKHHVLPHLGTMRAQQVKAIKIAELYGSLLKPKPEGSGLAPRTVGHVHRLLHRIFAQAVIWEVVAANPAATVKPPRVEPKKVEVLEPDQIKAVLAALRGRSLHPVALLGIATGMRRGELAALQWGDVDLEGGKVRVERSLEQTNAGLTFKAPKTKAGRRTITLPGSVMAELRAHRRRQSELRLALGLGKATGADLVLPRPDGSPWPPDSLTADWARNVRSLKLPKVTLHALRHTHASQLIASGLDVVTVSRRLGHSSPTVTLNVYAHLFGNTDERAAAIVEAALAGALAE